MPRIPPPSLVRLFTAAVAAWAVAHPPSAGPAGPPRTAGAGGIDFAARVPDAAAEADPPFVATPQHAVLLASSAVNSRRIWLVRLTPRALVYKEADHADDERTLTARAGLKAAVKLLDGDVFRIDPRSGRFNRFDELTGRFAPLRGGGVTLPEGRGEVHTEIASGSGTDAAAALADAFRNAVRQAVGVYVDSETLTDKEEVIADRVLTFSDAFVARYDELGRTTEDGLITVRIAAVIQAGKLMTNLREARINTLSLAGADLVAAALTRQEAKDAAAELLHRKLAELPGTLAAEAIPFKPLDYDARKEVLTVTYTLHADRDRYRAFLGSLEPLLSQVAVAKTSLVVKMEPIWSDGAAPVWQDDSTPKRLVAAQTIFTPGFRYGPNLGGLPDTWCLWLMSRWDAEHRNTQWRGFALDVDTSRMLGHLTGGVQVRLDLVDARGDVVRTVTRDPLDGLARPAYWFGWVRPRPRQFLAGQPRSWPGLGDCPSAPLLLTSFADRPLPVDQRTTLNVYVSPMCYAVSGVGPPVLAPGAWQLCRLPIPPDDLARVATIRAQPVFVPRDTTGAVTGASARPSVPIATSPEPSP